jgi:lipoyl(octanoyl) transferase
VAGAKIAALGLRVRQGRSYHGLSLNVDMDLAPFGRIHPCGYEGLRVTSLAELGVDEGLAGVSERLLDHLMHCLGYTCRSLSEESPISDV